MTRVFYNLLINSLFRQGGYDSYNIRVKTKERKITYVRGPGQIMTVAN